MADETATPPTDFSADIADVFELGVSGNAGEGAPPAPGAPAEGGLASPPPSGAGESGAEGTTVATPPAPGSTEPTPQPTSPEAPPPAQPAAGAQPQPQSPGAAPAPAPAASALAAPPVENREALLEATVTALRAELAARPAAAPAATSTVPPPAGQPGQPQPAAAPEVDDVTSTLGALPYGEIVLPQDVYTQIMDEDNTKSYAAMNHLVRTILQVAHSNVRKEMAAYFPKAYERLSADQTAATERAASINKMQDDYFGAFPQHKQVTAIVQEENAKLAAEYPGAPWSENYRNALGARVHGRIAGLGVPAPAPVASTPPAAPAPVAPAAKPPVFMGTTPRPADAGTQTTEDFIAETFG